jgi:ABC-2 type transport system permease protein
MNSFAIQLSNELYKLFARKRAYLGFGAIIVVEGVILWVLNRASSRAQLRQLIEQRGLSFAHYDSGLTIGLAMMIWTSLILGALFLALIAGDVVAKEVEDGALRMLLCRPVSRARVIALKYSACVVYTFVLVFFLGATALAAGTLCRGVGSLFVSSSAEQLFAVCEAREGLARYFLAMPFLALSLTSVSSVGFMFSCLKMKPAAATIATVSVVFIDSTFRQIPYFEGLRPLFFSTHLAGWIQLFATPIPWARLGQDYTYLLAVDAVCFLFALLVFQRRDFK